MSQDYTLSTGATNAETALIENANSRSEALRSAFSGTSFPTDPAPVEGQTCFRTDHGLMYRFDGTGWEMISPGFDDPLINGEMLLSERGSSFAAVANNQYTLDRWKLQHSSDAVINMAQSADVPSVAQCGKVLGSSLLVTIATADTTIAAGQYAAIGQPVKGRMWAPYAQRDICVSFWVKSSLTGIYDVALRNSVGDRSWVGEITINAVNTWELKTVLVTASPSAGTWDYAGGVGLTLSLALACGSTFQTTKDAWQSGNYFGTSSQVNFLGSTSNTLRITDVRIDPGYRRRNFVRRAADVERLVAGEYFERVNAGVTYGPFGIKRTSGILQFNIPLKFKKGGRTVSLFSSSPSWAPGATPSGNQIGAWGVTSAAYLTITGALTLSAFEANDDFVTFRATAATSFSGTTGEMVQLTLGTGASLGFEAEL